MLSAMAGVAWRAMTPAARREAACEEGIGWEGEGDEFRVFFAGNNAG